MQRNAFVRVSVAAAVLAGAVLTAVCVSRRANAHCQVPCGIYDDKARVAQLREDAITIEKAMRQIGDLAGSHDVQAFNQATRWVTTKEQHAGHIINVVAEYFLAQKVKPVKSGAEGYNDYLQTLADHHQVMVTAMKTKQHSDVTFVQALREAIDGLARHYQ